MNTKQTIGLFGFGNVGSNLVDVLQRGKTVNASVKAICIKNIDKKRSMPEEFFTNQPGKLLNDPEINIIVELIDDHVAAFQIVKQALSNGKHVVSGNKRMLAYHMEELIQLQEKHNSALLYEASSCGSIPIVRNLEEYYDNDLLKSITGILNGSSNYILTRIFKEGLDFQSALKQAQEKGFAESDPSLDVEGDDALYKLVILTLHGIGTYVHPDQIMKYGIDKIDERDVKYAKSNRQKIKLTGHALKIDNKSFTMFVLPRLVNHNKYIYNVENEFNGVIIEGECYDKQFMFGKGAGSYPTGSAVLSDITARMHDYRYEYKKRKYFAPMKYVTDAIIEIYLRYDDSADFSLFQFEEISEKFSGKNTNYVIGKIKLCNLIKLSPVLPKLNVFLAYTGNFFPPLETQNDNASAE